MSRITAEQAQRLCDAEEKVSQTRAALKEAEKDRDKLRGKLRPKLTVGREVRAGGVEIVVKTARKAASFRLADYLAKHKVTKAMEPHYTAASTRDDWTVKRTPGDG